jgi:MSHA pilin protein MshA
MNRREGFTLIELMIVVVILGVLMSIVIPNFLQLQDRAKEAKVKGAAHTVPLLANPGGLLPLVGRVRSAFWPWIRTV